MRHTRIEPIVRHPRFGLNELPTPSRKIVFITHSGLRIGCRWAPPARDQGEHAERLQSSLLWGRPLAHDQVMVTAMCTAERRP